VISARRPVSALSSRTVENGLMFVGFPPGLGEARSGASLSLYAV
jgi:hypothetical protein